MKYTYKQTKWGNVIEAVELEKQEFKKFILKYLEDFLKDWELYFSDYFESSLEGFDAECFRVNINGQHYVMKNGKEFIEVLKKVYGDLAEQLLENAKKEIIK